MMLYARDINGMLRIAETDAKHDMLDNQQRFVRDISKLLGVKIVKPVLGVVDSNKEEEEKWI